MSMQYESASIQGMLKRDKCLILNTKLTEDQNTLISEFFEGTSHNDMYYIKVHPPEGRWWTPVDQDWTVQIIGKEPWWYKENQEFYTNIILDAAKVWSEEHIISGRDTSMLSDGEYWLHDCEVGSINNSTVALSDMVVHEMVNCTGLDIRNSVVTATDSCNISQMNDSTIQVAIKTNISDIQGDSMVESLKDNSWIKNKGSDVEIHNMDKTCHLSKDNPKYKL